MPLECFNCNKTMNEDIPICPNCFVVQKNHFSREELFNYLETKLPTKPKKRTKYTSLKKNILTRDYNYWLFNGLFTFGIAYYYYLLLTLNDLNDHWILPHGTMENSTKNDLFISIILIIFTNFLSVPFIQYIRYEKLLRHINKAPTIPSKKLPPKGAYIFWLYFLLDILFLGVISFISFGILAIIGDYFLQYDLWLVVLIFIIIAILIFALLIVLAFILTIFERRWQNLFNEHIKWHERNNEKINLSISSTKQKKK